MFSYRFSLFNLDSVSNNSFNSAIEFYLLSYCSFMIGAILFQFYGRDNKKNLLKQKLQLTWQIPIALSSSLVKFSNFFFPLTYLLIFLVFGKQLFIRSEYLSSDIPRYAMLLVQLAVFLGSILSALIFQENKQKSIFYFSILTLLFFSTGSRVGVLLLIIFIAIKFVLKPNHYKKDWVALGLQIILVLLYLAFVMQLRGLDSHGIIPYAKQIFNIDAKIFREFFFNIYYIFIYGVFVTIETMLTAAKDWSVILTNINPLPGSMAGWYEVSKSRRINDYAPFSTHGEIFAMGKTLTFLFYSITGFIISYLDFRIRGWISQKKYFLGLIINLLIILYIFYSFEYNMRSSVRYIYYALFFVFLTWIFHFLKRVLVYLSHLENGNNEK